MRFTINLVAAPFICLALLFSCKNKEDTQLPAADSDNGGLFMPDGFRALVVADSIGGTRHIAVNANGDIYAKLKVIYGDKGNVALRDTNRDGKADIIERFGNYPNDGSFATEMRIHKGYLYFSSELVIYRQKLTPPALVPTSNIEVIVMDQYPVRWHNAKSLAFDDKGGLYVTFSAPSNVCEDWNSADGVTTAHVKGQDPCLQLNYLGGIWKFDINKKRQTQQDGQRFATGLRSVVALAWNNEHGGLFGLQHGRDYLHGHSPDVFSEWDNAVLPAEEFIRIKEGDNFGWPYTYYDQFQKKRILAPEYGGDGKKEDTRFQLPMMGFPAHWAPNDLLFYQGDQFPERYKNGAFVAFHGSTNRTPYPQAGYIVAFVPFKNGVALDDWEVFADGFAGKEPLKTMEEANYRPMGLAEGPDGSLYVSESKNGKIWRIMFTGNVTQFSDAQLAAMQRRKSMSHIRTPDKTKDLIK